MKTRIFLLLLLLSIPSTMIFAELDDDKMASSQRMDKCEYFLQHPNDLHNMCMYKRSCDGLEFTNEERKTVLKEDYLTQLFLQNNPWASLLRLGAIGNFDIENPWLVGSQNYHQDRNMVVSLNACSDITSIDYQDLNLYIHEKGDDGRAMLDIGEKNAYDSIVLVGEGKYEIAKRIIGKHLPPKVQIGEFGILPNKVQCNEGLARIFKVSGNSPACVTLQTKSELVERGWADETLVQQVSKNTILSLGIGFDLPEDDFTREDLEQLEKKEKELRKIRDNSDTTYEQRQLASSEIRQMQDRLQYPFQTGVPYHLVKEIKEKYTVLEINLDDAKKYVRFSVLNSGAISSEHHALRVGIHPQSFGMSELEFQDKKIREYLGNEMNILYEKVSVIPN